MSRLERRKATGVGRYMKIRYFIFLFESIEQGWQYFLKLHAKNNLIFFLCTVKLKNILKYIKKKKLWSNYLLIKIKYNKYFNFSRTADLPSQCIIHLYQYYRVLQYIKLSEIEHRLYNYCILCPILK